MVITYERGEFIKITHGDKVIAFNPISKKSKLEYTNFGADIALISANHPDFNGIENVSRKEKQPFVVKGPGEYEVSNLFIEGFLSKTNYGGKEIYNTIYTLVVDGINILFLGAISDTDLSNETKEGLGDIDIVFVPIGGEGVLEPDEAYKLAMKREPKLIIPIHYKDIGRKNALKEFLKEGGAESVKAIDKLTIKPKDLIGKEGEIIVLG